MTKLNKAIVGTLAAGAMAVGSATPAAAQDYRYDRDDDGIGAGEIIAGAVVLGGLAAILGSGNRDRYYDRDYRYNDSRYRDRNYRYNNTYNRRGNSRQAVDQCVRTAEREARRYGGTQAEVYEIRDIDRKRDGYKVKGRIAVRDGYGSYRRGYRNAGWDEGKFTCEVRYGRVADLDFSGIRRL